MKTSRGFTLIELLVVIAIIGMLSSVILASLNSARAKARDAQRISNIRQLKTSLELYYNDNGTYPQVGSQGVGRNIALLSSALTPTYIATIPVDPQNQVNYYVWGSNSNNNGPSYGLLVYTEAANTSCITGVNIEAGWWAGLGFGNCKF